MNTIELSKEQYDNLIEENANLKKENALLRSGKLARLYTKLDEHYQEIAKGKSFTRKDLRF